MLWTVGFFMMTGLDLYENRSRFSWWQVEIWYSGRPRFSWWQGEVFMIDDWDLHNELSRFSRWQVEIFMSVPNSHDDRSWFSWWEVQLFMINVQDFQRQPPRGVPVKSVLKICSKLTGEHPCKSAISIKLHCKFIKITLRHACSLVNLLHIFRTLFLKNTYR